MTNVLCLMVDEMAAWALEDPGIHLPNMRALAARGQVFGAAYTPSPICVPARACVATGRDLHQIGYWSSAEPYDGRVRSWHHALRDAGHEVVSVGKLHFRAEADDTGFSRQIHPLHVADGVGWPQALLRQPLCDYRPTADLARDIGAGTNGYHDFDRTVTRKAAVWLAEPARATAPWAAFVSWLSPHYPLVAPPEDYARYDPRAWQAGPQPVPDHPVLRQIANFFDHDQHFTSETRGIAQAAYRGLCTFVDRQIGKVLAALDAAGLAGDTLVIVTSDHGDMMGEHGFWAKSVMYEGSARVPLILAGPGVAAGRRDDPVSLIDLAPTICDALGVEAEFPGVSLLVPPRPGRTILSQYHDGGCPVGMTMVRWTDAQGPWKLVHFAEGHPPQLFHLPDETRDLAHDRPDRLAEGMARLTALIDPEAVNRQALADQARRMADLGGRAALEALPQWNFTPASGD